MLRTPGTPRVVVAGSPSVPVGVVTGRVRQLVVKYNVGDRCGVDRSLCSLGAVQSPNVLQKGVSDYTFVFGRHPRSPKVCCNIIGAG